MTDRNDQPSPDDLPLTDSDEGTPSDWVGAPESGGALRKKYEDALARIAELEQTNETGEGQLRAVTMNHAFEQLGLDPDKGIGKAAAQTFDGDPADLSAYVEAEYDYVPLNPLVPKIASSYAALDGLAGAAGSIRPPTPADDLANAERRGDTDTSIALKGQQLGDMLRPT